MGEHRAGLHHPAGAAHDAAGGELLPGHESGRSSAAGGDATTHGAGDACPIVNDSLIVALNDSVTWKNSTVTDSEIETPASKPTSIGW